MSKIPRGHTGLGMEFDVYPVNGRWRWRLTQTSGRIIATSGDDYGRKSTCIKAVKDLRERMKFSSVRVMNRRTRVWRLLSIAEY